VGKKPKVGRGDSLVQGGKKLYRREGKGTREQSIKKRRPEEGGAACSQKEGKFQFP